MDFLIKNLQEFNVLMFISIIVFNTVLTKSNTQKLLKEQSQEFYNDVEELKQEIWRAKK
jgi:energy-converting hydrogenase Eha subunit H